MLHHTLTDSDVETLITHLEPHGFNAWVTSSKRTEADFDNLIQLARSVGTSRVLENDSPLSEYAYHTFWQDLASNFPRMLGYALNLPDETERKRVFEALYGFEVYLNQREAQQSAVLAHGIRESGRGPMLHYILKESSQADVEVTAYYKETGVCVHGPNREHHRLSLPWYLILVLTPSLSTSLTLRTPLPHDYRREPTRLTQPCKRTSKLLDILRR